MLIQELDIREFRGIKKTIKPIKFSKFTVLIGRNNSGKSTILEAISLFPNPSSNDPIIGKARIDKLLDLHPSNLTGNRKLLYRYEGNAEIKFVVDNKDVSIHLDMKDVNLYEGNQIRKGDYFATQCKTIYIPNDSLIMQKIDVKIEFLRKLIEKNKIHRTIAETLSKYVDDNYSEIVFLTPLSIRKVFPDDSFFLELNDLGLGAEKIVKLMSLIESLKPDVLLLDDIEAGLHPSLIKMFIEWLGEKEWQTIISTHSIDVLHYFNEARIKNSSILQLQKSDEDILDYKGLAFDDVRDLFDGNLDPRLLLNL